MQSGFYIEEAVSIHAPPHGERQGTIQERLNTIEFQSTLPRTGSDGKLHLN